MTHAFAFRREWDYVDRLHLQKVTGRPAHEWDLYILKELLDNALDADEETWHSNSSLYPHIQVQIE